MNLKTRQALRICQFLPMQEREIMSSMPKELLEQLTSKQIALVMSALNEHWHKACRWKESQIIADGYIWDGEKLVNLVQENG